ncbi:MAG: FAD-binding protein, partial [Candidatus Thermochlorobacter aerophilum]
MIFKSDPLRKFSLTLEDTSANSRGLHKAGFILQKSYDEVCQILRDCNQTRTRVTLSGNGTGTTGGRIPFGGVVLAMPKLNQILSINKHSDGTGTATVQASALLYDVQQAVEAEGLLYPPDPTERFCF